MTKVELIVIIRSFLYRTRLAESDRFLYEQYCEATHKYLSGLKLTPAFWKVTTRALVHNLMMELSKLYDERRDVYGVTSINTLCKENMALFRNGQAMLSEVEKRINAKQSSITNLRNQRNKIWAHNDCKAFLTPAVIEKEFELSWGDIEDLINLAEWFGNSLLEGLGEVAQSKHYTNIDDVLLIFETMQKRAGDKQNG